MHYSAPAKVNIFLKIVGTRGNYHELMSRFMVVPTLCDTLRFVPKQTKEPFELIGAFDCPLSSNTLYKIYNVLLQEGFSDVQRVMEEQALHVTKRIPTGAGLGGGSSDAATFLKMLSEKATLKLSTYEMMALGSKVGADIAFFASGYASANVTGIGEIVEPFEEEALELEVVTPPLECHTGRVYQTYREYFLQTMDKPLALSMLSMKSDLLLERYTMEALNDLFPACLKAYPALKTYAQDGWFFSGSGSSFFKLSTKG